MKGGGKGGLGGKGGFGGKGGWGGKGKGGFGWGGPGMMLAEGLMVGAVAGACVGASCRRRGRGATQVVYVDAPVNRRTCVADERLVTKLAYMGFEDRELCRAALVATGNDLNAAISWLTQRSMEMQRSTGVQYATAPPPPSTGVHCPPAPPPPYEQTAVVVKAAPPSRERAVRPVVVVQEEERCACSIM